MFHSVYKRRAEKNANFNPAAFFFEFFVFFFKIQVALDLVSQLFSISTEIMSRFRSKPISKYGLCQISFEKDNLERSSCRICKNNNLCKKCYMVQNLEQPCSKDCKQLQSHFNEISTRKPYNKVTIIYLRFVLLFFSPK